MPAEADRSATGPSLRLLLLGDLRFGADPDPHRRMPEAVRAARVAELRSLPGRLAELVARHSVELVLVAGGLAESPLLPAAEAAVLMDALAAVAPVPVVVAPGRRDAWRVDSILNPALFGRLGVRPWPGNVTVFRSDSFETFRHPSRPEVAVVGRGRFPEAETAGRNGSAPTPSAAEAPAPPAPSDASEGAISLLVHPLGGGNPARGGRGGAGGASGASATWAAEAVGQGYSFVALGGTGRHFTVKDREGLIRAADPGPAAGLPVGSAGAKPTPGTPPGGRVLVASVTPSGIDPATLETPALDARTVREIRVDVSGAADAAEFRKRTLAAAAECGATPADIVLASAGGLYRPGAELPSVAGWAGQPYFHLELDCTAARPDYDLESLREGDGRRPTVERRFVESMMRRIEAAAEEGAAEEAETLEAALHAGLDALRHGRADREP
jgi:hypothetical protein